MKARRFGLYRFNLDGTKQLIRQGSIDALNDFAIKKDWKWIKEPSLFGGHWQHGNKAYVFDIVSTHDGKPQPDKTEEAITEHDDYELPLDTSRFLTWKVEETATGVLVTLKDRAFELPYSFQEVKEAIEAIRQTYADLPAEFDTMVEAYLTELSEHEGEPTSEPGLLAEVRFDDTRLNYTTPVSDVDWIEKALQNPAMKVYARGAIDMGVLRTEFGTYASHREKLADKRITHGMVIRNPDVWNPKLNQKHVDAVLMVLTDKNYKPVMSLGTHASVQSAVKMMHLHKQHVKGGVAEPRMEEARVGDRVKIKANAEHKNKGQAGTIKSITGGGGSHGMLLYDLTLDSGKTVLVKDNQIVPESAEADSAGVAEAFDVQEHANTLEGGSYGFIQLRDAVVEENNALRLWKRQMDEAYRINSAPVPLMRPLKSTWPLERSVSRQEAVEAFKDVFSIDSSGIADGGDTVSASRSPEIRG